MEDNLITVNLDNRDLTLNNKVLRKNGQIPGVISFSNAYSVPVQLSEQEVRRLSSLRNDVIKLNGLKLKSKQAVLVGVQTDPVKQNPIHFTLQALDGGASKNKLIRPVMIQAEGTPDWIKPYHSIQIPLDTIHVEGDLRKIPNVITIDLNELKEGETLHGSDIKVPKGIKVISEDLEKAYVTVMANNLELESDTQQETVPVESDMDEADQEPITTSA